MSLRHPRRPRGLAGNAELPFVPGHEGIGYVERLGAGVTTRSVGDRVAIAWLASACGQCRYCIGGWETLCEFQQSSGYSVNGSFAVRRGLSGAGC